MRSVTSIRARTSVLWQALGEESVLLDADSGTYYGLNAVGTRVWKLIQEPRSLVEVRDVLVLEFDVDPELCERDLHNLADELVRRGLAEMQSVA